jgi:long-chain acyl-CoA synthetase
VSARLLIEDVSLSFAGVRALQGVSLEVPAGALSAIIGPNGAGKTSLFNCISGLYRPDRGRIFLGERDITSLPCHRVAALGVARMFQNLALFENLTVLDNLLVGRHHLIRGRLWQNLLWTRATRDEEVAHRRRAEEIIEFLHLERYRGMPVQILPYGVRKRVELGRALAMEPTLLLLDEPTAGLNQEETEDMARYILDIKEELGITQILIEHELRFVLDLAETVAVLDFGRKIAEGTPAEIRVHPDVIAAYIGHGQHAVPVPAEPAHEIADIVPDMVPDMATARGEPAAEPRPADMPAAEPGRDALQRTLPGQLILRARELPDQVALRVKELGIWREVSWREYAHTVRATARMLWEKGVRPGDHVAIVSDNRPEWLYADLAAQSLGARGVGIYQTNPPEDVAYILSDCGAVVLFCEDQEQVDKAVAIAQATPTVRSVVVFDARGTADLDDPRLMRWDEFLARGGELAEAEADRDWFARCVAALDPDAPSMVVYTSGTTGAPKGAMISSSNVVAVTRAFVEVMGIDSSDSMLSYLPLCHVAEKIFSVFLPLATGAVVHFGESIDTVQNDLREVSPTVFLGVPRIWEKMHASVHVKMQDSSWLKRILFRLLSRKGADIAARKQQGAVGLWDRMAWRIGDLLIYRPLQERLGLRRCWLAVTGAAPISPELLHWFHGVGIAIAEGYGQTECAGVSHICRPGAVRLGTVGEAVPLVECRLADDGEVLVRGPNVFCGYLNQPDATPIDEQGWLHTGDIGSIDERGNLSITGRKKEIIITSGGKNLSPERIENALKTSPYIKEAVAVGDSRKFISALVQIEYDRVGDWATRRGIAHTSHTDLAGKDEVVALIADEIDKANEHLARVEEVRAFRLLDRELSQDEGELTATQKVRRRVIHEAYADLIESMYRSRPHGQTRGNTA